MRRTYAAWLCFVWLLGVEVLPNLHLASHASDDHEHTSDGMVVTVSFDRAGATHAHDDGTVHADHAALEKPAKKKRSPIGVLAIDRVPDLHVASGLAHRVVALHEAPAPILDAVAVDRVVTDIVDVAIGRETIAFVATAHARGPPIV